MKLKGLKLWKMYLQNILNVLLAKKPKSGQKKIILILQKEILLLGTPTEQELSKWIEKSGQDIKKWFNTSGIKYKELNLKDKLNNMNKEEKIKLLASDGMLIKRPLLISNKGIFIGFKEEIWKTL